jgi:hypothetical protein
MTLNSCLIFYSPALRLLELVELILNIYLILVLMCVVLAVNIPSIRSYSNIFAIPDLIILIEY